MAALIVFAVGTFATWLAWIFVIMRFDPNSGGFIVHGLFYASLGLALQGTLMLVGFFWQKHAAGRIASRVEVGMIARQALLFNGFLLLCLFLASRQLLRWWNLIPLAILTLVFELFFISLQKKSQVSSPSIRTIQTNR